MVAVQHLLRGDAFLLGADGDGSAVGIAAGDHEDIVAPHPVVTGEDVGGKVAAGDVTHVEGPVGVGPCDPDEDAL